MNKNTPWIAGAAVAVVAIAAYFVWSWPFTPAPVKFVAPPTPSAVQTNQVAELHKKLSQQNREVARLKTENKALWEGLSNAVTATAAPAPKGATEETASRRANRDARMKGISLYSRQQSELKLAILKSRLRLTDEQAAMVEELLKKQDDAVQRIVLGREEGKQPHELENPLVKFDFDRELKQVLTPDQWTGYEQYKTEEKQQQTQRAAQGELMQVSPALQLTPQQTEQVSGILQQHYQQLTTPPGSPGSAGPDQMLDAKKEALRAVLTPEQQQIYEKFIETQREIMKNSLKW